MGKLNGHFKRWHGQVRCRLRGSGRHGRWPGGHAGQPVACGAHRAADADRGRQIRNRIEAAHDRLAGLVAPGAAAGIARLIAGEA
jgi:hypothetical protein